MFDPQFNTLMGVFEEERQKVIHINPLDSVDFSNIVCLDIVNKFNKLAVNGVPNRKRPIDADYLWNKEEVEFVKSRLRDENRPVSIEPC